MESYAKHVFQMKNLPVPSEADLVALDNEWKKFQQMRQNISPDILLANDILYRYEEEVESK